VPSAGAAAGTVASVNMWALTEPLLVDRAAERRDHVDLTALDAVVVRDGAVLAMDGHVVLLPPAEQPPASLRLFLGMDAGRGLAAIVPEDPAFGTDTDGIGGDSMTPLRALLGQLSARGRDGARDRELAATAVALATWHATHPVCSRCGDATEPVRGGWVRYCERDQKEHYPRTDAAVIVAITDLEDRLLLAHASYWSPRRFSHLAGYVEPGESLEQTVHREVYEEAQLTLRDLKYVGSQPWPFPASIMVGFTATVDSPEFVLDQEEISEAMFVSREEIVALVAEGTIILAPHGSIARRLLEDWFGGPLADGVPAERIDV
jgi:NAD+ diphosphatase